jgi:hypothetical protein
MSIDGIPNQSDTGFERIKIDPNWLAIFTLSGEV